jgi:hypothetical protein
MCVCALNFIACYSNGNADVGKQQWRGREDDNGDPTYRNECLGICGIDVSHLIQHFGSQIPDIALSS